MRETVLFRAINLTFMTGTSPLPFFPSAHKRFAVLHHTEGTAVARQEEGRVWPRNQGHAHC